MPQVWFIKAMKDFFGFAGRTATEFAAELKQLSYPEKLEFARMLRDQAGVDCADPAKPDK